MPKLNGVLMVLGALAVIAAAGALSLRLSGPDGPDGGQIQKLLRGLSDPDPDVRREAEEGLSQLGTRAQSVLAQASKSEDLAVAQRASKLLERLEGASLNKGAISRRSPEAGVPGSPKGASLSEPPSAELLEFALVCSGPPEHADPAGLIFVQFQNRSSVPILLLLQPDSVERPVGFFEVETEQGSVTRVAATPLSPVEGALSQVAVPPGSDRMIYCSSTLLAEVAGRKAAKKLRFVYEASERSPYRDQVAPGKDGVPLPPFRFITKTYLLASTH